MINAYTLSRLGVVVFAGGVTTLVYAEFLSGEFWLGVAGMIVGLVMPFAYSEFWPRNSTHRSGT